jgi:hypothetical protein
MSNSVKDLLELMAQGTVTQGWGAVCAFSRNRLNRLLEQQYIDRFQRMTFMPALLGDAPLDDVLIKTATLAKIELGPPLLSFNSASLKNPTASVTMNIVGGQFSTRNRGVGIDEPLASSFIITEQMGYKLELDVDLSVVLGEIDRQGKVTLDLSCGVSFRCNLAGEDVHQPENVHLASFFQKQFENLPPDRSVFELGMLGLKGYNALTPRSFRVATQPAPGAKVRGAKNFGDGAVVVFIQLRVNPEPGNFPPEGYFPYLIPDGNPEQYSASVVVSQDLLGHVEDDRLEVLSNLLFPGAHAFQETERYTPRDLAVFGAINPSQTSFAVAPLFNTIKAGESQQFVLHDWQGDVIEAQDWQAVSLQSHLPQGEGIITPDGYYTAASPTDIGHDSLNVIITATYRSENTTYSASAMLLVVFDGMQLSPRVITSHGGKLAQPVALRASILAGSAPDWAPLGPQYGELIEVGTGAVFTPDARAGKKSLLVQQIEASGSVKKSASVLLINGQQMSRVEPAHVPLLAKSEGMQLVDDNTLLQNLARRWKVLGGGGKVNSAGCFTAPSDSTGSSSIVSCEVVHNGVVFSSGYSVIELSELKEEQSWSTLSLFQVKVPGGFEGGSMGSLYPNGYQQLKVHIRTETQLVDDIHISLSPKELASMRLVNNYDYQNIPEVNAVLDGIPEVDDQPWRVAKVLNRFELAMQQPTTQQASLKLLSFKARAQNGVTDQDFYLHSRAIPNDSLNVHATFQAQATGQWPVSTDIAGNDGLIVVTPIRIPYFGDEDYEFTVARAHGEGGTPTVDPPPENAADDPFDFHFLTGDYWTLGFRPRSTEISVPFETLEFLPDDEMDPFMSTNSSTILWESEQLNEKYFSWTGYIFHDPLAKENTCDIQFDPAVKQIVKNPALLKVLINDQKFTQGTLVISLHRHDEVPYVPSSDPARLKLDKSLRVLLRDKQGNAHKRMISFLYPGQVGRRNRLEHKLLR